jgi:nicotinamide-nucleotide amidase
MKNTDPELARLAVRVGRALLRSERSAATAESCTGGWIAKAMTDIAGSSQWFVEGFVTYSNQSKVRCLGVPMSVLRSQGAVSEAVARAMALGALRRSDRKRFTGDREAVRRKTVRAALAGLLKR